MSRFNPFEERRKNERINRLVKENTELKSKVDKLEQDYESKRLYADLMEQAVKVTQSQTQELIEQNAELVDILRHVVYEYKQNEQSYSTIREIKELLTKFNRLKSNTNETDKI